MKKAVLRNLAKFIGKHLCQSLFFNKVAGAACNFIKKETLSQVLSCEFCAISKNTFFTEHVWATASDHRLLLNYTIEENNYSSQEYESTILVASNKTLQ